MQSNDPKKFGVEVPNGVLDMKSWFESMKMANVSYAVYVAKHNCGFTTWPTKVRLPDGSPYNYSIQYSSIPDIDVVKQFLDLCKEYNIMPGFYYSIATNTFLNVANNKVEDSEILKGQVKVTQQQFYDIALAQLEELWSIYGTENLFEIWFDG